MKTVFFLCVFGVIVSSHVLQQLRNISKDLNEHQLKEQCDCRKVFFLSVLTKNSSNSIEQDQCLNICGGMTKPSASKSARSLDIAIFRRGRNIYGMSYGEYGNNYGSDEYSKDDSSSSSSSSSSSESFEEGNDFPPFFPPGFTTPPRATTTAPDPCKATDSAFFGTKIMLITQL
uniref:Uncharacterized protein n=1 Tax=Panagrolaimus davidi TaxID=227884 RepID=A0A914QU35_9BILA